jgi:hypothetical protein
MNLRAHYSGHPAAPYYSVPNAPQGVVISYYVGRQKPTFHKVKFTIESPSGSRLAVLHGPSSFGVHELVWNMRYRGPHPLRIGPPVPPGFMNRSFGPMAVPGTYRVIARAGSNQAEMTAQVREDPRHPIALSIWREDLGLGLTARNELSDFNRLLNRLQTVKVALSRISSHPAPKDVPATLVAQGRKLEARVSHFENRLYNPLIQRNAPEDSLHYLARFHREINMAYGVASFFLQGRAPNHRMLAILRKRRGELRKILDQYNREIRPAIAAYNAKAWHLGQPTLPQGKAIHLHKPVRL